MGNKFKIGRDCRFFYVSSALFNEPNTTVNIEPITFKQENYK